MKAVIFAKVSERLPQKHLLPICNKPMILYIYERLKEIKEFDDIIIFSKNPSINFGIHIERDDSEGTLIDAISMSIKKFGLIFALGGDMPLVDEEVIHLILRNFKKPATYGLNDQNIPEPLLAIYDPSVLRDLDNYRINSKSISKFLYQYGNPVKLGFMSQKTKSVNTTEDYEFIKNKINC